jgi:hypothetical protein
MSEIRNQIMPIVSEIVIAIDAFPPPTGEI